MNTVTDAATVNATAMAALRAGRLKEARGLLERGLVACGEDISLWLNLAGACRAMGDFPAAMGAVDGALRVDPRSFQALLVKASLLERQGSPRHAGIAYGHAIGQAPSPDLIDAPTSKALDHARRFHDRYAADLRQTLVEATSQAGALARGPETRRIEAFIDHLAGRRRVYHQRPSSFFYPGLPAIEFYPREEFSWLSEIEEATNAIRRDLESALADESQAEHFTPYVAYPHDVPLDQWAELNQSSRWSAFYLFRDGELVTPAAAHCPATMAALGLAPQPTVSRRSPAAMFSVLQPATRIPPHTGVSNTRLVVHLPLVLPSDCGFRVGNETREWREGEAWVFDDTIEHEAWNDSVHPRTILIFDIWSPYLSVAERELIAAVTGAMDDFNGFVPDATL